MKYIVVYDDNVSEIVPSDRKGSVFSFKDFLDIGKSFTAKNDEDSLEARMKNQKPGNCCTIVYTSGTTGLPKGVMLSHDNYTWTAYRLVDMINLEKGKDRMVTYLPLSHVAG